MINLLIILGVLCFAEMDAMTRGITSHSDTVSKQMAVSKLMLLKEKCFEQEQRRNIPYYRVLIYLDHPLMITKFSKIEGKEGILSVSKLTKLIDGFNVRSTKTFKSLIFNAGERIKMLDNTEMQTSLVLFPNTSNSIFKTNIWIAFGHPEYECEEGFMTQEEFEAATKRM